MAVSSIIFVVIVTVIICAILVRAPNTRCQRLGVAMKAEAKQAASIHDRDLAQIAKYQKLYYKLQNLEHNPDILSLARDTLLELFTQTLEHGIGKLSLISRILSVRKYSKESLMTFLHEEQDQVTMKWKNYIESRESGQPRRLFQTRQNAKTWLKCISPHKLVDGAWLGHINTITMSFALRGIIKNAWQILSEEYGDGDLDKHHVHIYRSLMKSINVDLPPASKKDFIDPRHWEGSAPLSVWKSAVVQLLISLFPNEFLPEILGFNLHFERVSEETLIASRELKEVGIDPYYFLIHVCIDNMDSGHTAMAVKVIQDYMDYVASHNNERMVERAWRGIQVGYMVSAMFPSTSTSENVGGGDYNTARNQYAAEVEKIFVSKASACHRIHCGVNTKIGTRNLDEWLDPKAMASSAWRTELVRELSQAKHLVHQGNSAKSRLIRELSWKGRMFGAFTDSEVQVMKDWIDALPPFDQKYWDFIGENRRASAQVLKNQDKASSHSVFGSPLGILSSRQLSSQPRMPTSAMRSNGVYLEHLLPLWFTQPVLLEAFLAVPSRTASVFGCAIVRLTRAQIGFDLEASGVAGLDEANRSPLGLIEMGLEIVKRHEMHVPSSLLEVLDKWPSDFARHMLNLSKYPETRTVTLLGFVHAFIDLHRLVTSTDLLTTETRIVLDVMVQREDHCLKLCLQGLQQDGNVLHPVFREAYELAREEIDKCLHGRRLERSDVESDLVEDML